jgi:hypothetical protein
MSPTFYLVQDNPGYFEIRDFFFPDQMVKVALQAFYIFSFSEFAPCFRCALTETISEHPAATPAVQTVMDTVSPLFQGNRTDSLSGVNASGLPAATFELPTVDFFLFHDNPHDVFLQLQDSG